jgi:hypothetical protein
MVYTFFHVQQVTVFHCLFLTLRGAEAVRASDEAVLTPETLEVLVAVAPQDSDAEIIKVCS